MGHIVSLVLPDQLSRMMCPKTRPTFKIKQDVVKDSLFQERLRDSMENWTEIKSYGLDVVPWWDLIVKPGVKQLAIQRSKEMNKLKRGEINLLFLRHAYLTRKIQQGQTERMGELRAVHGLIDQWFCKESERIKHQSKVDEFQ